MSDKKDPDAGVMPLLLFVGCVGVFLVFSGLMSAFGILVKFVLLYMFSKLILFKHEHRIKDEPDREQWEDKCTIYSVMCSGGYTIYQEDGEFFARVGEEFVHRSVWRFNVSDEKVYCIDVNHKVKSGNMLGLQEFMAKEQEEYNSAIAKKEEYLSRKGKGFEGFVKMGGEV
jgi:hypothetical protein